MGKPIELKGNQAVEWTEKTVKLSALKPYERNPRKITKEAFDRLKNRIDRLGYHQRIICQPDGGVIGGHVRLRALTELGYKEVKVLIPNRELSQEEFREALISDNGQFGEWDIDMLAADFEIEELVEWGVPEALVDGFREPDFTPDPDGAPRLDEKKKHTCPECGAEFED